MIEYPSDFFYGLRSHPNDGNDERLWLCGMSEDIPVYCFPIQDDEYDERFGDLTFKGRFENFVLDDLSLAVATKISFSKANREDHFRLVAMFRYLYESGSKWTFRVRRHRSAVAPIEFIFGTNDFATYAGFYENWGMLVSDTCDPEYGDS